MMVLQWRWRTGGAAALLAAALLSVLTGCASPQYASGQLDPQGDTEPVTALGPGDEIEIQFFYTPTLTTRQTVRRDGKISLQLVGEIYVEGMDPVELEAQLEELYSAHLRDPDVAVVVVGQWMNRILVGGEVKRAGGMAMPAPITVLEALMRAGGPDPARAELENVLVIRQAGERRVVDSLDLRAQLGWKEPGPEDSMAPFYLKPGDIVYVPETRIVKLDRWLDQHLYEVFAGFEIITVTGTTTVGYDVFDVDVED